MALVTHCVVAIIVNFVARHPVAIVAIVVVVVVVAHSPSLLSPVATKAIIVEVVARRAVIIVVDVVVRHAVAIIIESVSL